MTYGPPNLTPRPVEPARDEAWRVVLVVLGCLFGPGAAAFAGFFGLITFTGCFLSCDGAAADPLAGGLLLVLALGLLLSGPLLAWALIRRASAVLVAVLGTGGGGLALVGAVQLGAL